MKRALVISLLAALASASPARAADSAPVRLANRKITESSGIAYSLRRDGVLWTHNDSGDGPNLFATDFEGRDLGTYIVDGAGAIDWEDMCAAMIDGTPRLIVADVGNNNLKRPIVNLYVVEEPDAGTSRVARLKETITFRFEDGPYNCEALAATPDGKTLYLISKIEDGWCSVYELHGPKTPNELVVARAIATIPIKEVTAMDISRDNTHAVVLTYEDAFEYERTGTNTWAQAFAGTPRRLVMPDSDQAEAICYSPDGNTLFVTSEGSPAPLWRIAAPRPRP